jgi:hypothetical protein
MISALLLVAASASNPIYIGTFNPADFPNAVKVDRRMPQEDLTARADRVMKAGRCQFPGQSVDRYSITIPYAVRIDPAGDVTRLVVKDVGCPELELLTGEVANELSKARDFRRTKTAEEQWYVSEVYYAHGGVDVAQAQADDDKIVCEAPKEITGSRLGAKRDCRTKAQWRQYELDRQRLHQDLLRDGMNADSNKQGVVFYGTSPSSGRP